MRVTKEPEIRRAELIEAARQLFDKNGIKNTQVSQIVEKVGVAKGLFYYYFKSKDEIVNEVVDLVMSELKEASLKILADTQLTFQEMRKRIWTACWKSFPITPSPRMPMSFCRHSWNG